MAITWIEQGVTWNSSPPFIRNFGYEITARDASSVTFKLHLQMKINRNTTSAYYGYPIYWSVNGGTSHTIKGTERWYGGQDYRTFNITVKVSSGVTTSAGTYSPKIKVWASSGGTMSYTKTYSLSYPAYNSAPVFPSNALTFIREKNEFGKLVTNKVVGEDVSAFHLIWDEATDVDNNIEKYEVWHSVNGGTFSKVSTLLSNKSYTHQISGGVSTQGYYYDYYIKAVDSYGASATLPTVRVTKNILTPASITKSETIEFNTDLINIGFNPASNTEGDTNFTYMIASEAIEIYNNQNFTGTIKIVEGNFMDSVPYILKSDLNEYFKNKNFKGNLPITLYTTNKFGSTASTNGTIPVDLQTPPNPPTEIVISEKTITNLGEFIIPNKQRTRITYEGAQDLLGGNLVYSVSYSIDNGNTFISITNETPNTSLLMDLPTVKVATPIIFRVVTKSVSTGKTTTKDLVGETLHFYNQPTITLLNPVRTSNTFSVDVKTVINTSIPNVELGKQDFTGLSGEIKTFKGSYVTIVDEGLTEESSYNLYVASNDNTGLSNVITSIWVNQAKPVLSIRENGVGIGCVNSDNGYILEINGGIKVTGESSIEGIEAEIPDSLSLTSLTADNVYGTNVTGANSEFQNVMVNSGGNKLLIDPLKLTLNGNSVLEFDSSSNHILLNKKRTYSGLAVGGYIQIQDGSGTMNYKTSGISKGAKEVLNSDGTTININKDFSHNLIQMWGDVQYKVKGTYYTATTAINLRLTPSWSGTVHRVASKGEKLLVIKIENGWAEVNDNGTKCYAPAEHITIVASVSHSFIDENDEKIGEITLASNGIYCEDIYINTPSTIYSNEDIYSRLRSICTNRSGSQMISQSEINSLLLQAMYSVISTM